MASFLPDFVKEAVMGRPVAETSGSVEELTSQLASEDDVEKQQRILDELQRMAKAGVMITQCLAWHACKGVYHLCLAFLGGKLEIGMRAMGFLVSVLGKVESDIYLLRSTLKLLILVSCELFTEAHHLRLCLVS